MMKMSKRILAVLLALLLPLLLAVEENTEPVVPDAPVEPEKQGLSDWGIIGIAAIVAVMLIIVITVAGNKKRARKNGEHGNIQL